MAEDSVLQCKIMLDMVGRPVVEIFFVLDELMPRNLAFVSGTSYGMTPKLWCQRQA